MNREEVKNLFKIIIDVYPRFQVNASKVDTWTRMLQGQTYKDAEINLIEHCKVSKFEPTIADVCRPVRVQSKPFVMDMTEGESLEY